jgi:hypothetical protein
MHAGRCVQGGPMMCLQISCKRQECLQQTLRRLCHNLAESCKRMQLACSLLRTELSNNLIYMFALFVVVEKRKKSTFKVPSFSGCLLIRANIANTTMLARLRHLRASRTSAHPPAPQQGAPPARTGRHWVRAPANRPASAARPCAVDQL